MKNGNYQEFEVVMQPRQAVLNSLQQQSSNSRILVVDDNDENRQLLEVFLDECAYEVVSASNGYEAWRLIENENIDLVLTDICMPGVSGNELAQYIKIARKALPVIAITGSSCLAGGYFDKIITKPLRLHILLYWVKFFLAKASTQSGTGGEDL